MHTHIHTHAHVHTHRRTARAFQVSLVAGDKGRESSELPLRLGFQTDGFVITACDHDSLGSAPAQLGQCLEKNKTFSVRPLDSESSINWLQMHKVSTSQSMSSLRSSVWLVRGSAQS